MVVRLRGNGIPMRFVTNTTKESKGTLLRRLVQIGFDIQPEEVFTSLSAARQLVQRRNLRPMFLLEPDAMEDFTGIKTEQPDAVVVGLAPACFQYDTLNEAFRCATLQPPLVCRYVTSLMKRGNRDKCNDVQMHLGIV